jgi:hypothetical protein
MSVIKKAAVLAAGAAAAVIYLAAPAHADPDDNPCADAPFPVTIICHIVPTSPDLDHDVDLTKDFGTDNGATDDKPPTPICINGCY